MLPTPCRRPYRPTMTTNHGHSELAAANERVTASPHIRELANQLGVDLREVRGTGAGGRISTTDVRATFAGEAAAARADADAALKSATAATLARKEYEARQPPSTILWPDSETGPWLIGTTWTVAGSRVECVRVELRSYREPSEAWAEGRLPLLGDDAVSPVDSTVWRSIPIARVIQQARERAQEDVEAWFDRALSNPSLPQWMRDDAEAMRAAWRARPERGPLTREAVAQVYRDALSHGEPPTKAVEREFRLSASAAAKQVARARAAGLLPSTTRGKAR